MSKRDPVTFTADAVSYDRDRGIVTATGHVEAWQNDHQLRADTVTYDRNTDVTRRPRPRPAHRPQWPGGVRRLRRTHLGHEGRRAARHARDPRRQRQARRQRRAAHQRPDQRTQPGGLFHLQPVREAPGCAAAMAVARPHRGAGPGEQTHRVSGRLSRRIRPADLLLPLLLPRRSVGEALQRLPGPLDRLLDPSRPVRPGTLLLGAGPVVGPHHRAAGRDADRPPAGFHLSPGAQLRFDHHQRLGRLRPGAFPGPSLRGRQVHLQRYLALRLRHQSRHLDRLPARLPDRPACRQRAEHTVVHRRIRPRFLQQAFGAVVPRPQQHGHQQRSAVRAAGATSIPISG